MKARNLNNSSKKTRRAIKTEFARLLAEKQEVGKIPVSELCRRAEISRGTFYSHYTDIYGVAEDYENELIEIFFNGTELGNISEIETFLERLFDYFKENNENYTLLCRSNDFMFTARRLTALAESRLYELCIADPRIRNREYLDIEINVFIDGIFGEYVKGCRGVSDVTLERLHQFTLLWVHSFIARRAVPDASEHD